MSLQLSLSAILTTSTIKGEHRNTTDRYGSKEGVVGFFLGDGGGGAVAGVGFCLAGEGEELFFHTGEKL